MEHAFECLGLCQVCKGSGKVKRKQCFLCRGSGDCRREWRGTTPAKAPCRLDTCCVCAGDPCGKSWCLECRLVIPNGWPCAKGSCPSCGGNYVEWLSFDVVRADVYLNYEIYGKPPLRRLPSHVSIRPKRNRLHP